MTAKKLLENCNTNIKWYKRILIMINMIIRDNLEVIKRDKFCILMKIFVDCLIQKEQIQIQNM